MSTYVDLDADSNSDSFSPRLPQFSKVYDRETPVPANANANANVNGNASANANEQSVASFSLSLGWDSKYAIALYVALILMSLVYFYWTVVEFDVSTNEDTNLTLEFATEERTRKSN